MSCIDDTASRGLWACLSGEHLRRLLGGGCVLTLALAGCSNSPSTVGTTPGASSPGLQSTGPARPAGPGASAPAGAGKSTGNAGPSLAPPKTPRSHAELRRQAAQRLVAANPDRTYLGTVPDVLLAIPVLEVELSAEGHVRHIKVLRRPGQAVDTVQLAMDAVHRAAPYGNVGGLPKPWVFSETFLFNDQRRFKPRTLDE